jgi:hypothetical protein
MKGERPRFRSILHRTFDMKQFQAASHEEPLVIRVVVKVGLPAPNRIAVPEHTW